LFFSAALQGHDTCLGVAEDAPNKGSRTEAREPIRIGKAQRFSHAPIMPSLLAREKEKNRRKMAPNSPIRPLAYPLTWEKSQIKNTLRKRRRNEDAVRKIQGPVA
jgi:hypothetical protein